jgi:hypothetical protein
VRSVRRRPRTGVGAERTFPQPAVAEDSLDHIGLAALGNRPRREAVALGRPLQRGRGRGQGPVGAVGFIRNQTLAGRGCVRGVPDCERVSPRIGPNLFWSTARGRGGRRCRPGPRTTLAIGRLRSFRELTEGDQVIGEVTIATRVPKKRFLSRFRGGPGRATRNEWRAPGALEVWGLASLDPSHPPSCAPRKWEKNQN